MLWNWPMQRRSGPISFYHDYDGQQIAARNAELGYHMRIYLTLHLVAIILVDQLFRNFTAPLSQDWLKPLLWLGFVLASVASLWIFSRLLRRGTTIAHRTFAFLAAWGVFYLMWSAGIVFASSVTHARLKRVYDDVFILFSGSSGQQFEVWNWDAHVNFLMAALPIFLVAAVISFVIHVMTRHIYPQLSQNTAA